MLLATESDIEALNYVDNDDDDDDDGYDNDEDQHHRCYDGSSRASDGGGSFRSRATNSGVNSGYKNHALTVTGLILVLGCAATGAFLTIGILNAIHESQRDFENDVNELAVRVHNAFREYETTALWVHQFCQSHKLRPPQTTATSSEETLQWRTDNDDNAGSNLTTASSGIEPLSSSVSWLYPPNFRSLFRDLYEAVVLKELPLHAIQYIPNITRYDRDYFEHEARTFYEEFYPDMARNYTGFSGFVPDDSVPLGISLAPRAPQDFYFPVHFVEPVLDNIGVLDFDVYSEDYPRWAVNTAVATQKPVITGRLRLIQEYDPSPDAFSVLMMHPGLETSNPYNDEGNRINGDISLVAIRIPSLLDYISQQEHLYDTWDNYGDGRGDGHMPDMKVYLYDSTPDDPTLTEPLYLGGAFVRHGKDHTDMDYLPQIGLSELSPGEGSSSFHSIQLEIGLRQWTLVCIKGDGTYPPDILFGIVGGVIIFVAFLVLSYWVYTNMNKTARKSRLKAKRQEERALVRIDNASQAAAAERQLNEFIAHEVRNPLSAAMSACSFITTTIQEMDNGFFAPDNNSSISKTHTNQPLPPPPSSQQEEKDASLPPPHPQPTVPDGLFAAISDSLPSKRNSSPGAFSMKSLSGGSPSPHPPALTPLFAAFDGHQSDSDMDHQLRQQRRLSSAIAAGMHQQQLGQQKQYEETRQSVLADLHIIESSLQFVFDLLRNMLDVQRAACHQLKIEKGPTDILRDILEPVDAMLYRRGRIDVNVIIECSDPNLLVETDRLRLKQVVLNLGRNASKFVERGHIKFKVVVIPGNIPGIADTQHGTVQIWVEDTGPGIPDCKKDKLFAKFQESLDSLSQGTGLGLSLCKTLVRLMGADIWLDESYHSGFDDRPGSRFVIDLKTPPLLVTDDENDKETDAPSSSTAMSSTEMLQDSSDATHGDGGGSPGVRDNNGQKMGESSATMSKGDESGVRSSSGASRTAQSLEESPPLPSSLSVLFVDDDTVLRKLLVRAIRGIAPTWSLQEAASGEAALRLVDEGHSFDLIFMDQYMASMQKQLLGTEATHALRSKGVRAKICGLSANEMATDFFAAGANAFCCKPLPTKKGALHQILHEILRDIEADAGLEEQEDDPAPSSSAFRRPKESLVMLAHA